MAHEGEIASIDFPETFGDFKESDESSIMLDMTPNKEGFKGTAYDHHPRLFDDFKLVTEGEIPCATGLVYKAFKDKIPKEELWKVAVGFLGDGQANNIPPEIWMKCPELLDDVFHLGKWGLFEFGDNRITKLKTYQELSSPVNAACRVGQPRTALELLAKAKSPRDLIENRMLNKFKSEVRKEQNYLLERAKIQTIGNLFVYFPFESEYKVQSLLATKIEAKFGMTTIAHNFKMDSASVRGVLVDFLKQELVERGYSIGGHSGYAGISNPNEGNLLKTLEIVSSRLGKRE